MAKRVPNQTLEQKLQEAERKAAGLRHQLSERRRQAEARRKIVIGGTIELAMVDDPDFRAKVVALLRQHVTRPPDREVVADLLGDGDAIHLHGPPPTPDMAHGETPERMTA